MNHRLRVALLACGILAALPHVARAQAHPTDAIVGADELYFAGSPLEAYDLLTAHLEAHPSDYEAL